MSVSATKASRWTSLMLWSRAVPPTVWLVLLLTALVSVLVFALSEMAFVSIFSQRQDVSRYIQAQTALLRLNEQVAQAESSQRGYALTRNTLYLPAYQQAIAGARAAQASLQSVLSQETELGSPVLTLGHVVSQRIDALNLTNEINVVARASPPGRAPSATDELKLRTDLALATRTLDTLLTQRLQTRLQALTELFWRQRWGVGLVVFLNLAFLAAMGANLVRRFYEREASRHALAAHTLSLEQAVKDRTTELEELSTYLLSSAEEERRSLARDLHDEFGALLTCAKLDVAWLAGRLASTDEAALPRLTQLSQSLDEAVNLKRRVLESLRPSLLDHLGLAAALQWYVQETCDRADLACDVQVPDGPDGIPPHIAIDLYRLVQEGVNNAIKYAQASLLTVALQQVERQWQISIHDDGVGMRNFRPQHLSHGLAGMRHRVRALGGRFDIVTAPGRGTHIEAWVPMQEGPLGPLHTRQAA